MSTLSLTNVNSGGVIYAADHNTQNAEITAWANGNIDADNLADLGVTTAKVANDSITTSKLSLPINDWTPTYANITVGNGTVVAKYVETDNIIHFFWSLTFGSTSSFAASHTISLPVEANTLYTETIDVIGPTGIAFDSSSGASVPIQAIVNSSTVFRLRGIDSNAVYYNLTNTVPYTWATGDIISVKGWYFK